MKYLILFLLVACRLPHVAPESRPLWAQYATDVKIESSCDMHNEHAHGSGVIISERHVLTAAHLVGCAFIPVVHVYLPDGRVFRMVVERDDRMFGDGADIARLEIASAERFGLGISPPVLGVYLSGDKICLSGGCGFVSRYELNFVEAPSDPGDAGRAIYDWYGRLMGIVGETDGHWTKIAPVTPYWLEGT